MGRPRLNWIKVAKGRGASLETSSGDGMVLWLRLFYLGFIGELERGASAKIGGLNILKYLTGVNMERYPNILDQLDPISRQAR